MLQLQSENQIYLRPYFCNKAKSKFILPLFLQSLQTLFYMTDFQAYISDFV